MIGTRDQRGLTADPTVALWPRRAAGFPRRCSAFAFFHSAIVVTLGVTGGIGSGKTTVCGFLEEQGARVFYADIEAKRLMQENPDVRAAIVDAFGEGAYNEDGVLDRAYLADRVFEDAEQLERLNRIVHPRVFEAFEAATQRAADEGLPLLVHEAALLFEAGGDEHVDRTAAVVAPDADRIAWVVERDGATPEQVQARMQHQLPQNDLRTRADYVIENDGSLGDLRQKSVDLYWSVVSRQ
jgi:dephospho-CoA kinase